MDPTSNPRSCTRAARRAFRFCRFTPALSGGAAVPLQDMRDRPVPPFLAALLRLAVKAELLLLLPGISNKGTQAGEARAGVVLDY